MSSIYESNVDPLRPNDAHGISLQLVGRNKSVLELGAAAGHVTKALKQLGNTVTSVERDGRYLENLRSIADNVHITDLDWLNLRELLDGQTFDVILAGDVLEHCTRPDLVLLQCHGLLAPGGSVVVSLPNVAHGDVRLALLSGRFEYRAVGLLDNTHLRFFTRDTIVDFADSCGFDVTEMFGSTATIGSTEFGAPDSSIPREAIEYVQADRDHTVYQYVSRFIPRLNFSTTVTPQPTERAVEKLLAELAQSQEALAFLRSVGSGPRNKEIITRLESELEEARKIAVDKLGELEAMSSQCGDKELEIARLTLGHDEMTSTIDEMTSTIDEMTSTIDEMTSNYQALQIKFLAARDHAIGATAELGETRFHHESARREIDSLVHQLNLLHSSRTWRIGRFVLLPLRGLRKVLRKLTA